MASENILSFEELLQIIKSSWKLIAKITLLTFFTALTVAYILPVKFTATGLLQTGQVLGKDIESVQVLAEKLRLPSFYSEKTINACLQRKELGDELSYKMTNELGVSVGRNSPFLAISFKAPSNEVGRLCLEAVLDNVVSKQYELSKPRLDRANNDLRIAKNRLAIARIKQKQDIDQNIEKLEIYKQGLREIETFLRDFETKIINFDFKNENFSATSLLLATFIGKQSEAKAIKIQISDLELKVLAGITGREDEIFVLEKQIDEIEKSLMPPLTESARFAAPVFSPLFKSEPKRTLILALGIVAGLLLGVSYVLYKNLLNKTVLK